MTWPPAPTSQPEYRAGDDDRERALDLLRIHWLAGRLTVDEYEERCDEVGQARYLSELAVAVRELPIPGPPPAPPSAAAAPPSSALGVTGLVLGIVAMVVLLFTFGFSAIVTLPMSVGAWVCGRTARRRAHPASTGVATAAEILGIVGTVCSLLALSACAMFASMF